MSQMTALLDKLGLFSRKADEPDAFDLRLTRIGNREQRVETHPCDVFRSRQLPPEDAALS